MSRSFMLGFVLVLSAQAAHAQGNAANAAPPDQGPATVPGWSLMTPAERAEHRQKMASFTRYEDCVAYATEHHKLMQERAKAKGTSLPAAPRLAMCERLKQSGSSK